MMKNYYIAWSIGLDKQVSTTLNKDYVHTRDKRIYSHFKEINQCLQCYLNFVVSIPLTT